MGKISKLGVATYRRRKKEEKRRGKRKIGKVKREKVEMTRGEKQEGERGVRTVSVGKEWTRERGSEKENNDKEEGRGERRRIGKW